MPVYSQRTGQHSCRLSQMLRPETDSLSAKTSMNAGEKVSVTLLEVTRMDIRGVVNTNPEIGDSLRFDVERPGGRKIEVSGIVHWKELRRNGYEVGVYLPSGLPTGLTNAITDTRRTSNRYRCRQAGRVVARSAQARSEAVAVNYSIDGIGIQTGACCDIDDVVTFEWHTDDVCQQISGQILWQIERNNGSLLGCQVDSGAGYQIAGLNFGG